MEWIGRRWALQASRQAGGGEVILEHREKWVHGISSEKRNNTKRPRRTTTTVANDNDQ